jgi:hypothetical protein
MEQTEPLHKQYQPFTAGNHTITVTDANVAASATGAVTEPAQQLQPQ